MKIIEAPNEMFFVQITQAASCLRCNDFEKAYNLITEAIRMEPDAPQPHNLLGIWFELQGNGDKARRHYRAAYSLDPTFSPACKNLEQICTFFDNTHTRTYVFGDETEETHHAETIKHNQKTHF